MPKVHFIGDPTLVVKFKPDYEFDALLKKLEEYNVCALDTETTVVDSILNRELKVVSIAVDRGETIGVFEWDALSPSEQDALGKYMITRKSIIQNVAFDYTILKKYGIVLENVVCTMLGEQLLTNGIKQENGYNGLKAIYHRRFNIDISKADQLTFGSSPYNDSQIQYAAIDVLKLEDVWTQQSTEMKSDDAYLKLKAHKGSYKTWGLENEFAKVVGDMEYTGIRIDKEKWYAIEDAVQPVFDAKLLELNVLVQEEYLEIITNLNFISDVDEFIKPVWTSAKIKGLILSEIYNFEIIKTSKEELKKYLKEHDPNFPEDQKLSGKSWSESEYAIDFTDIFAVLKLLIANSKADDLTEHLNKFLLSNMRDFLIENNLIRPKNTVSVNWASHIQRLKVFNAIESTIESTGKDILLEYLHINVIRVYLDWAEVAYQLKNFGKAFYDDHVELDGKHRAHYKQILTTGRLSTSKPNILNISRKYDGVYRDAVIPDDGYVMVGCDYSSQELVITAVLSQEPEWLRAIGNGWDLHSRNADLIFGDLWKRAAQDDCAYFKDQAYQKCSCSTHKEMRDQVKTIGFGILYGASEFSTADRLKIPVKEAKSLLKKFFDSFPNIKKMMDKFASYATSNARIIEPMFGRSRFFEKWKLFDDAEKSGIARQAMNMPIQGAAGGMLKLALVLFRRWVIHNDHSKEVQLLMPYHDEVILQVRPEKLDLVKEKLEYFMELSGKLGGFPNIKAEAVHGATWKQCK